MALEVTRVTRPVEMGEGPHWDESTQSLYFVDMHRSQIHKYNPSANLHTFATVENEALEKKPVTFVIPLDGTTDKFVIGFGGEVATVQWDGVSPKTKCFHRVHVLESEYPRVRLNDAKANPQGVLFAGSMGERKADGSFPRNKGNLFALIQGVPKLVVSDVGISNGLGWDFEENTMYYVDSLTCKLEAFNYDKLTMKLMNRRTVFDFLEHGLVDPPNILPDGLTVDEIGNVWVALIGASKIVKINPGESYLVNTVEFPCSQITSATFGGPTLKDLYVTSAYKGISEEEHVRKPDSGCVFKVTGFKHGGKPGVPVKL